jgi:hypothetical protein
VIILKCWHEIVQQLKATNKLHIGVINALDEFTVRYEHWVSNLTTVESLKLFLRQSVDKYIQEKIVYAQEAMVENGMSLLSKKKNTVMVYGQD